MHETGLRPRVSGAIFQDWLRAKVIENHKRPAGEATVRFFSLAGCIAVNYSENQIKATLEEYL